jgi:phosphoribosylglycinamide formyltransferase-1
VRIGVLASGAGTILQALVAKELPIAVVLVDRPCRAAAIAESAGIAVETVLRKDFGASFDRAAYTDDVLAALAPYEIDLIAMAGFGTILSAALPAAYPGRVLNTHPALLPAFKGWHPVRAALVAGVKVTGCTVHVATALVDDGPILAQVAVAVLPGDDEELLSERIKTVERELYPATLQRAIATLERGEELV